MELSPPTQRDEQQDLVLHRVSLSRGARDGTRNEDSSLADVREDESFRSNSHYPEPSLSHLTVPKKQSFRLLRNLSRNSFAQDYEQRQTSSSSSVTKKFASNFTQQKLKAWQPVLTPKWIISIFVVLAFLFGTIGIILLQVNSNIVECVLKYNDPKNSCSDITKCTTVFEETFTSEHCTGPLSNNVIRPPVFVYYELHNYYQNHRRYVKSRSDDQLRGVVYTNADDLQSCSPIIYGTENRILSPCGLVAWSVFNDSFQFSKDNSIIPMNESADTIAWAMDIQYRFKNPPADEINEAIIEEWLNEEIFPGKVENGHFIVWMRNAPLPTFRKLYGKIETTITLPITVTISSRYPVQDFGGTKSIVLSTTTWLGGKSSFLGITYIVVSCWCLILSFFFVFKSFTSPRILGDVRYLKWVQQTKRRYESTS